MRPQMTMELPSSTYNNHYNGNNSKSSYNSSTGTSSIVESPKAEQIWSTERRLLERPHPPSAPRKSGRRSFTTAAAAVAASSSSSSGVVDHARTSSSCYESSWKKQRNNNTYRPLILPSRAIHDDDDDDDDDDDSEMNSTRNATGQMALNFHHLRTNLLPFFDNTVTDGGSETESSIEAFSSTRPSMIQNDPTTVLLIPEISPLPWYNNDNDDSNDDSDDANDIYDNDVVLSHRLFRFDPIQQQQLQCNNTFTSIDFSDNNENSDHDDDYDNSDDDDSDDKDDSDEYVNMKRNDIFRTRPSDTEDDEINIDADLDDEYYDENDDDDDDNINESRDSSIQRRNTWSTYNNNNSTTMSTGIALTSSYNSCIDRDNNDRL